MALPVYGLIEYVAGLNVRLRCEAGQLRYSAPAGVLSSSLRRALGDNREQLCKLIAELGEDYAAELERQRHTMHMQELALVPIVDQGRIWRVCKPGSSPDFGINIFNILFRLSRTKCEAAVLAITKIAGMDGVLSGRVVDIDGPVIDTGAAFPIGVREINVDEGPLGARDARSMDVAFTEIWRPFELDKEPLLRCFVVNVSEEERLLGIVLHRLVAGVNSFRELCNEVLELASKKSLDSEANRSRHGLMDELILRNRWLDSPEAWREHVYWLGQLAGAPRRTGMDILAPTGSAHEMLCQEEFSISENILSGLRSTGIRLNTTLFTVILSAHLMALHRVSGQPDLVVNVPFSVVGYVEAESGGRTRTNHCYFRVCLAEGMTPLEVVQLVRSTLRQAFDHGTLPFEHIAESICNGYLEAPVFNFFPYRADVVPADFSKLGEVIPVPQPVVSFPPFAPPEVTYIVTLAEGRNSISGTISFKKAIYDRRLVMRLIDAFMMVLKALAEDGREPEGVTWVLAGSTS